MAAGPGGRWRGSVRGPMALARPARPQPDPALMGWGDPAQVPVLPDTVLAMLRDGLGVRAPAAPAPDPEAIELPQIRSAPRRERH